MDRHTSPLEACEEAGGTAYADGLRRMDNPYAATPARWKQLAIREACQRLAEAWWRGWDQAELSRSPSGQSPLNWHQPTSVPDRVRSKQLNPHPRHGGKPAKVVNAVSGRKKEGATPFDVTP